MSAEEKDRLVVFRGIVPREKVLEVYEQTYGRPPEVIHSPEESQTAFWWVGRVSLEEYRQHKMEKTA